MIENQKIFFMVLTLMLHNLYLKQVKINQNIKKLKI